MQIRWVKKNLKIPQIIMLTIYYSYVSYLLSRFVTKIAAVVYDPPLFRGLSNF